MTVPRAGSSPLVTVVVVSYNHRSFVTEALDSVAAQTVQPTRIVVADDASRDDSVEVIRRWVQDHDDLDVVEIFHARNTGLCPILNEALARVDTPLYAYISADDRMLPDRLALQTRRWQDHRGTAAAVYSDARRIDEHGRRLAPDYSAAHGWDGVTALEGHLHTDLLHHNWIPAASVLLHAPSVRRVGGYNESWFYEDHDLWLRLTAAGDEFLCVHQPLVEVRELASSLGSTGFGADRPVHLAARLGILLDHHGVSKEGDAYIEDVVPHLATTLWRTGERADLVARAFGLLAAGRDPRWRVRARMVDLGLTREPRMAHWCRSALNRRKGPAS